MERRSISSSRFHGFRMVVFVLVALAIVAYLLACYGAQIAGFALAVRSQQVVHPVWTEEAEVAEALAILGGPDEHS